MSIDARIGGVIRHADGSGKLVLVDRPAKVPGIAGQASLSFDSSPKDVGNLLGHDIWGGSGQIILGREQKIADRIGYGGIRFTVPNFSDVQVLQESQS